MSDVSLIMEHRFLSECKIPYAAFAEHCLAKQESPVRCVYSRHTLTPLSSSCSSGALRARPSC